MHDATQQKVSQTFLDIAEQLTFMFGEPEDKADLVLGGVPFLGAAISFEGDINGTLGVAVPTEITTEITANILGLEPEEIETDAMRRDALAEMLNVICGHVIPALVGSGADFKLHSPKTETVAAEVLEAMLASEDWIGFLLDDSPVLLGLDLED